MFYNMKMSFMRIYENAMLIFSLVLDEIYTGCYNVTEFRSKPFKIGRDSFGKLVKIRSISLLIRRITAGGPSYYKF